MTDPARRRLLTGLAFVSPNLALFLVFSLVPAVFTLGIAFFRWDPFTTPQFVGFDNFNHLFADRTFWYVMGNTLVFMLGLPLSLVGSLTLAVLLAVR